LRKVFTGRSSSVSGCWWISGAKLQHENDLPLARAPETTARNPSTHISPGLGFSSGACGGFGPARWAARLSPAARFVRVQSHKAAIGSAEKDISRDVKNSQGFGPALTPLVQA
jgi:hypothetical protein